jgi:pimeloyl-ACP methyl ester carboxylesterase
MKARSYGTERVVRFGADNGLVGILTSAAGGARRDVVPPRPAVIFLNSGILHRIGSCRFHVHMARELSAAGFNCLRFDYSGIGDSEPRRDALPFEASAVLETREAMDRLQRLTGARQFILIGLCSGADMAHSTAVVDERVVGLHLIDAWSYRTVGFYVHHYAPRVLSPSVWANAVRCRIADLGRVFKSRPARALPDGVEFELPTYTRVFPPRDKVAEDLRALVARGVQLRMLWTSGLPEHNHMGQYAAAFSDVDFGDRLEEDHLPSADHIITGLDDQAIVTERAVRWATRLWPMPQATPVHPPTRTRPMSAPQTSMPRLTLLSFCLFTLLAAGCSAERTTPTQSHGREPVLPADGVGDRSNAFDIEPGVVNVCVFFPNSAGVGVATAEIVASGPETEYMLRGIQSITPAPHCIEVWNATTTQPVEVTAAVITSPGYILDRIQRATGNEHGAIWIDPLFDVTSATISVSDLVGGAIWFKFRSPGQEDLRGEGCAPNYWTQANAVEAWPAPYEPDMLFSQVFANAFPNQTLRDVLALRGDGLEALGRHSVAALLNASSAKVNSDLTPVDVVAGFNNVYLSANRPAMRNQQGLFGMLNNQECPLP